MRSSYCSRVDFLALLVAASEENSEGVVSKVIPVAKRAIRGEWLTVCRRCEMEAARSASSKMSSESGRGRTGLAAERADVDARARRGRLLRCWGRLLAFAHEAVSVGLYRTVQLKGTHPGRKYSSCRC